MVAFPSPFLSLTAFPAPLPARPSSSNPGQQMNIRRDCRTGGTFGRQFTSATFLHWMNSVNTCLLQ